MINFILKAFELKDEERAGWKLRGIRRPESVGDHSWGTALLCWLYAPAAASEAHGEAERVDRARAVAMAVFHDVAEAEIGDIATRVHETERTVPPEEKQRREREAFATMRLLLGGAGTGGADPEAGDRSAASGDATGAAGEAGESEPAAELTALWEEYEEGSSATARFVRDMNLCDMCAQALLYERHRRYDARADSSAFRNFSALDEFFETSRGRISTELGARLFADIERRYRGELDSRDGQA